MWMLSFECYCCKNTGVEIIVVLCMGCSQWNKTSIRRYIENDWWNFLRRPFRREGSGRMEGDWYWMEVSALQLVLPTGLSALGASPRTQNSYHPARYNQTTGRKKNGLHKYFLRKSGLASRSVLWLCVTMIPNQWDPARFYQSSK